MKPWNTLKRGRYDTLGFTLETHLSVFKTSHLDLNHLFPLCSSIFFDQFYFLSIIPAFLFPSKNFLRKMEQIFMCVCCQELAFQPITTVCSHNVCKVCVTRTLAKLFVLTTKQKSLRVILLASSVHRLVSSGHSERRCTPAPPAVTTWARTMS